MREKRRGRGGEMLAEASQEATESTSSAVSTMIPSRNGMFLGTGDIKSQGTQPVWYREIF